jgi:hypothetical protein
MEPVLKQPESNTEVQESAWAELGRMWVLGHLLPALIGLGLTLHQHAVEDAEQERRRAVENKKMVDQANKEVNERIRNGAATDVELILAGIDRAEYDKYRSRLRAANEETE